MRLELRGTLRARSRAKAEKLVARACAEVELDHTAASFEREPGPSPSFSFRLVQELPDQDFRDAYFDVLARLCGLSDAWHVHAPHVFPSDQFFFEGSSDNTTVSGVEYVEFVVVREPARD